MARSFASAALFACVALAFAHAQTLIYIDPVSGAQSTDAPRTVVLPSYGETSASLSFFYRGAAAKSKAVSRGNLYTAGRIIESKYKDYVNYTIPFVFDKDVGTEAYSFSVEDTSGKTVTITGRFVVAGITIKERGSNKVVSGDDGPGVSVKSSGKYSYDVKAVGVDGGPGVVSDVKITFKEMAGVYMKEVKSASMTATQFIMEIAPYRVGTGSFMVNFEAPSIAKDGESFETVLNVRQETNPAPPCVVVGGDVKISKTGLITVPMYNLQKPPQAKPVSEIAMTVNGKAYSYIKSTSTRTIPDQKIVFKPEVIGSATFTCDGEPAKIIGGGGKLTITGKVPDGPVGPLAVDTVISLPLSTKFDTFSARIRVLDSDPTLLLASEARAITNQMCVVIGGTGCVHEKVVAGSAIISCAGYVAKGDKTGEAKLRGSVDKCDFQKAVNKDCPDIEIVDVTVVPSKVVSAAGFSAAGTGVLAPWTIVLIAVVGAFAIILLIMLALWAVYRRNAEQSESDYSSSGPLGVPDPSDLLYEQSIVRDIYGRGDFPEGGPTAAAAAERAREADLREEFPRPPSSSDVSRGAATDDASSTYSV